MEMGEDQILVIIMEMEVGIPLLLQRIHPQEEENIEGLDLFMYCKDLLDKKDNQDKQEEMAEMGKPHK